MAAETRVAFRTGEAQHPFDPIYRMRSTFTATDVTLLDEIADTILPDTAKSPGAKAARVGAFMALMVTDCYEPADQQIFRAGMKQLDDACKATHNTAFVSATPAQRQQVLEVIDREAKQYMDAKKADQRGDCAGKTSLIPAAPCGPRRGHCPSC